MKKHFLSVLFAAVIIAVCSLDVFAFSDSDFISPQMYDAYGFYTVITDVEGDKHTYDGVINAKELEFFDELDKISAYEIFENDSSIIIVTLNDIIPKNSVSLSEQGTVTTNGYYSVKFTLSAEDNTEVFLTGLSDSNIDMVQEKLVSAKLENSQFTMESLDFIDAEKTKAPDGGNDELCWAAATSNILHYTGWGEKAGFNSEDDLFDLFRDSFTDIVGSAGYGIEWFFNGTYQKQSYDSWAHVKDYGKSGGYLKEYASDCVNDYIYVSNNHEKIKDVTDALENGWGICFTLGWVDDYGNRNGGHLLTTWGYICDKDFTQQDADYYKALIVSDSDSDRQTDTNRRIAPNKLNVLNMTPYAKFSYDTWSFDGYDGVLEFFTLLEPYSENVEYETDESATLDKFSNVDINIKSINISTDSLYTTFLMNVYSAQDSIYVFPEFENTSLKDFVGTLDYTVTVTDKSNNSEIISKNGTYTGKIYSYESSDTSQAETISIGSLSAGKYTVTVTVNPEKTVTEAYYYNNTETYDFSVSDKSYDVSGASINANIGEFAYGLADVTLEYTGLETVLNTMFEDLPEDTQEVNYQLFESYYYNKKWNSWMITDTSEELPAGSVSLMSALTSPPDKCRVNANGEKVKFRLVIKAGDESIPVINIYSAEQDLNYSRLDINADETNTGTYTELECGAKALADGESFAFKVKKTSTYDSGDITCSAVVYAKNDNDRIELFRQDNISLAYGESTDTLSFNSWTSDNLSGEYEIIAVTECDCTYADISLGRIYVEEHPFFTVTTESDTENPYDGMISLREAVSYMKEYGGAEDEIIFEDSVHYIYLSKPLTIDADIKIEGNFNEDWENYTAIHSREGTQLFNVTGSGTLECESLNLRSGYSKENGGAVENKGGSVYLKNCIMFENKSGAAGGAIYSDGGSVKLVNCVFTENSSGYGGAIGLSGNAKLDMLNCSVFLNTSNGGAIYNNSGTATIIYSTFTDNTASSSGGGAITSLGKTNVFGSIATLNGDTDIDGNVNVYGSYVTNVSDKITVDATTINGAGNRMFVCDTGGAVVWHTFVESSVVVYKAELSPLVNGGIYVKNSDGKITYSIDNTEWKATDISSVFTDEDYKADIFGKEHGRLFGSISEVCSDIKIIDAANNKAYIYVPEAMNAVLIEMNENYDDIMAGVNIYEESLDMGTNIIDINNTNTDSDITTYFLWNSIDEMIPLCESCVKYNRIYL